MPRVPALPPETQKLRDQLEVSQAPSARNRTEFFDLSILHGHLGNPYSSRKIPLSTCYEMRTDAIIMFAELVALSVRLQSEWYIECRNAQLANFIDRALRRIYGRTIGMFNMRRSFGFQGMAKEFVKMKPSWQYLNKDAEGGPQLEPVWDYGDIPALLWDPPVPLRPEVVEPVWDANGRFDGIKLNAGGFSSIPGIISYTDPKTEKTVNKVDIRHALWVVNERDWQFGSVWGYPRAGYAYKFWRAYEMVLGILARSIEKKGDPTIVVSFPPGTTPINGVEVDNQQIAYQIGEAARSGSVLVIPSTMWGTEEGGKPQWHVETLKYEENFDKLSGVLSYLDVMKVRAMGIGEQSVMEGRGGTSSRNVAQVVGERSAEMQSLPQTEDDDTINRYMIPQLIESNFPELRDEPCRKVTKTFGEGQAELARTLLESYANANSGKLPIDWEQILKEGGIATLEGDALQRFYDAQHQLEQRAEESTPPEVAPGSNGTAGVQQTGFGEYFYYDGRERIDLAPEDSTLLAQLPPTKHYQDRAILAQTRLIRKLWFDLFTDQYENFAKYLERDDVDLDEIQFAEGDDVDKRAKKTAEAIVKAWRFSSNSYKTAVKRTGEVLSEIFKRAGEIELRRTNVKLDEWKPEEKELADWVQNNAAAMVRKVEETTRKQLRTFLVNQVKANKNAPEIAAELREHFSEFPSWRADLIAREEVRRFYNAATLFAARDAAGAKQVQALDARHGPTDAECEKRNGRLFSIEDAFREDESEHVRGTLAWRILSTKTQLAIEYRSAEEMDWVGARVERESGIIYLTEGLPPEIEGKYLLQVGDWLEAVPS